MKVEVLLNCLDNVCLLRHDKVDDGTGVTVKSMNMFDSIDIVLLRERSVVVNHKTTLFRAVFFEEDLISGDEDTTGTGTEFLYDLITSLLIHLNLHYGDTEIVLLQLVAQLSNSLIVVAKDDGRVDVKVSVEVQEDVYLPLFLLNWDVVMSVVF